VLQLGADLETDVVVIAESWPDQGNGSQHGTYNLQLNTTYLAVYTRKDMVVECRKRGGGEWLSIGGNTGAGYIPPHWEQHRLRRTLLSMVRELDTIMGDFNCCGGTKKRVLQEIIEAEEWDDIGTSHHTQEWGKHKCKIDP